MERPAIESMLQNIDEKYHPGALPWAKRKRPEDWKRMIRRESEINGAGLRGDEAGLTKALNEYERHVFQMVNAFDASNRETGSLF